MQETAAPDLVATRLSPPATEGTLTRDGLNARVQAAVDDPAVRLVLVSAPAGAGKSTLVATALAASGAAAGWLQVDASDDDPVRFWRYLTAAVGTVHPHIELAAQSLVPTTAADPEPLIARLVNLLAEAGPTALVLDDYHLLSNPAVHAGVQRLVELAPPGTTVALITRTDPSLRLGRLRVRGQVVELRGDDLRFTPTDASALLGPAAGVLDAAQIAALCERTEGWAAGLVLAGISLAGAADADGFVQSFRGTDRLVEDYLTDEFLAHLATDEELRLLRTSHLGQMSGPLVDAVLGTTDGAAWLRRTAAANHLLIALDHTGTWFRCHHLLADLLRREAAARIPGELPDLQVRAGRWHADHGDPHQAVEHLLAGGALGEAADLIWANGTRLLNGGELRTVRQQIRRLGPIADDHPGCLIVTAWIGLLRGRFDEARRAIQRAGAHGSDDPVVLGMLDALGIMLGIVEGDIAAAMRIAESAHEPTESTQVMSLALAHTLAGRFTDARRLAANARRRAGEEGHRFVDVATQGYEALVALEEGRYAEAQRLAAAAVAAAAAAGYDEMTQMGPAHTVLARVAADGDEAVAAARRGVQLARRGAGAVVLAYSLAAAAQVLAPTSPDEAARLLGEARTVVGKCADPGIAGPYVARVASVVRAAAPTTGGLVEPLTEREVAVLHHLPTPLSQREIAAELFVSLNTVKTHCRAIFRKLGVGDRKAAVRAAREHGLL
ncbi:MAG: LuxR C-terminal-related transcriptional regulator [Ilumatobacteraceae bacterium]